METNLETSSSSGKFEHFSDAVEATVRHRGNETRFLGTPDGVIRELIGYFAKVYPSLEIAAKLILTVDNTDFLQSCRGVIAVTPEGPVVLKETRNLKDKEILMLQLTGSKLANTLGKRENDILSLDEITKATGRSTGTVAGRLSELCTEQLVERAGKGSYRLTTLGVRAVMKSLMPKLVGLPDR